MLWFSSGILKVYILFQLLDRQTSQEHFYGVEAFTQYTDKHRTIA